MAASNLGSAAQSSIKRIMNSMNKPAQTGGPRPPRPLRNSLKSGWLRKQGGVVKSWHRRWFVLNGDVMYYYADADCSKKLGNFLLPGNLVYEHSHNPQEPDKFLFEIRPGGEKSRVTATHDCYLLCATSEEERRGWIQTIKRVMYADCGGAIFGLTLQETMAFESRKSNRKVPEIVEMCVEYLMKYGLTVEGIFRLPGRTSYVRELRDKFDMGQRPQFQFPETDIHSVASLLKLYFRELPEPIIPIVLYPDIVKLTCRELQVNPEGAFEGLRELLSCVPRTNYNLLQYLCQYLREISRHENENRMSAMNLATIFMHYILQPEGDDPTLLMATASPRTQTVFVLITQWDHLFKLEYNAHGALLQVDNLLDFGDGLKDEFKVDTTMAAPQRASQMDNLLDLDFGDAPLSSPLLTGADIAIPAPSASTVSQEPVYDELQAQATESIESSQDTVEPQASVERHHSLTRVAPPRPEPPRRRTSSDPPPPQTPTRPAPIPSQGMSKSNTDLTASPPLSLPPESGADMLDSGLAKSVSSESSMDGLVPHRVAPPPPPSAVQHAVSLDSISTVDSGRSTDLEEEEEAIESLVATNVADLPVEELKSHIKDLCTELKSQRAKYREATQKFKQMKEKHTIKITEMAKKLDEQREATLQAVNTVVDLRTQLIQFQ